MTIASPPRPFLSLRTFQRLSRHRRARERRALVLAGSALAGVLGLAGYVLLRDALPSPSKAVDARPRSGIAPEARTRE